MLMLGCTILPMDTGQLGTMELTMVLKKQSFYCYILTSSSINFCLSYELKTAVD